MKIIDRFFRVHETAVPLILICIGVVLLSYYLVHSYFYWRSLRLSSNQVQRVIQPDRTVFEPNHIFIRWFVDSPIEPMALTGTTWGISPTKVSYLLSSGLPGKGGNIILYGHNTRQILGNIRALKGGEKITITTNEGKEYYYTVQSFQEVQPTDARLLQPTTTEVLTMYTCSGIFDSLRFIVRAVPLDK